MGSSSSKTLAARPHSLQTGGGGPAHFANQAESKPYRHQIATCYFLAAMVGHGPQTPYNAHVYVRNQQLSLACRLASYDKIYDSIGTPCSTGCFWACPTMDLGTCCNNFSESLALVAWFKPPQRDLWGSMRTFCSF